MALADQLQQEIKKAMLAKDADRLNALRMLKSAIGYVQIEKKTDALSDADFIAVVQREVKKRRDSIEQFTNAGRLELAAKETAEIAVLEIFLPKPLSPEELESLIRATIQEVGATDKKQMGAVMKAVQAKVAGRADGKTISGIVGKLLP
ncbi:MAG TPA: GatB/YqeY domain-containing protein [Candidatus Limnocylindria bacterium]|nr:GatB/YqeY domain-containing protein [Candidatus Limnocylindria bacterium]